MSSEEHYRRLERMYHGAPCNRDTAPHIVVSRGAAAVTLLLRPDLAHSGGSIHGSVLFKLLDDAAFFAVNSLLTDLLATTANFSLYFLRPARSGTLTATGTVVSSGKTVWLAESRIVDDRGKEVARGSGSFMKTSVVLNESIGYCM